MDSNNPRLSAVREDLITQISDVFPSPGTILVVHPKYEWAWFNPEFCGWLASTLQTLLPEGVKAMVLSQNMSKFNVIRPESGSDEYRHGWDDAIKAIAELVP